MNQGTKLNIRTASVVLVFVLAVGLAFYGGRVYQNNVDKPLFTQYNPPTTTGGTGGASGRGSSYFGAVSSGGSQIQAALAYATPPGSTTSQSGGTANGTSGGQTGTGATGGQTGTGATGGQGGTGATGGQGGTGATGGQGGTGATGGQGGSGTTGGQSTGAATDSTEVAGTLVSLANGKLTIKTSQGANQTVSTTASTTYYDAQKATSSAITKGQNVTISMAASGSSQGFSAGDITIAPPGALYGYVKQQAPAAGGFGFSPAGTVVSLSGSTLTLQTSTGRSLSISIDNSTAVYQLVKTTSSAIHAGTTVSALKDTSGATALNVVACSLDGMVASLTTPRARGAGGFGGGSGGTGGYGGQGGQGGGQSNPNGNGS